MKIIDTAGMRKTIKQIAGQKTCSSRTGCMESKEGAIIMKKIRYYRDGLNTLQNSSTITEERNL